MKNNKGLTRKKTIGGYLMTAMLGIAIGFSTLGFGFAASPTMAEDGIESEYTDVWEAVDAQAEIEDLEILAEYMDDTKLEMAKSNADTICEILQNYCEYDAEFYDVICDYFC